eukprot:4045889-Heterocapsa_arctica.AAC.1
MARWVERLLLGLPREKSGLLLYVHMLGATFYILLGVPIPKHNHKEGPASFRLVHVLDDAGKAWSRGLWKRVPLTWDEHSMGVIPGRRREEAHLILRAVLWRLTQPRQGWIACFWDVANAFPSLGRSLLDGLASRIADPETAKFITDRYNNRLNI